MTAAVPDLGPILPVVVIDDATHGARLAEALLAGGIRSAEITLRTTAGVEAIRAASAVEGFTVGAGTVLTVHDLEEVRDAGAAFAVSPGLDFEVIDRALALNLPILPGIATATELQQANRRGVTEVKVFPASLVGGPAFLQALSGPFPAARFLPSGGVTLDNCRDYLALSSVDTVSGSWMVPRAALQARDYAEVTRLAREAVRRLAGP